MPRGGRLWEVAQRTRRSREGVVQGRRRVMEEVAWRRKWSKEAGSGERRARGGDGPAEVLQGRRCPREGCPGEEVQESKNMRGGSGVGTPGRRFSRRENSEKEDQGGRRSSGRMTKGEHGCLGEEVQGGRDGEGARGRSFSGDGGKEKAQGTLSGAGGDQEKVAQERRPGGGGGGSGQGMWRWVGEARGRLRLAGRCGVAR